MHLKAILQVLQQHEIKVNKKKYNFGQNSLEYLGHIISRKGVEADPSKLAAMAEWPGPKDAKGLRGFLGLAGYYRRFVKDCGKIAQPLNALLKKDAFHWREEATHAFEELKAAMRKLPILAIPDFSMSFILEIDASGTRLGAALLQEEKP